MVVVAVVAVAATGWWVWSRLGGPSLGVTVASPAPEAQVGDDLVFDVVVRNDGPGLAGAVVARVTAPESAVVTVPEGCALQEGVYRCDVGDLEEGAEVALSFPVGLPEAGSYLVEASASATEGEASGGGGPAEAEVALTGAPCALVGTGGDDELQAPDAGGLVCGFGGDDTLTSGPGDDVLAGGSGHDEASYATATAGVVVDLGSASATGQGRDTFQGIEAVAGSPQADTMTGGPEDDLLKGEGGDDVLAGLGGNDFLDGGEGRDRLDLSGSPAAVEVTLVGGKVAGEAEGEDVVTAAEDVTGSAFDDTIQGDIGPNTLDGGEGDDTLIAMAGDDVLDGGAGVDTVSFSGGAKGVGVDLAAGLSFGQGDDRLTGFEAVMGTKWADVLAGTDADDRLDGGQGPDTLDGRAGADDLNGGPGKDACVQGETEGGTERSCELEPYASADGLTMVRPSPEIIGYGFHESLFSSAMDMRPYGTLQENDNGRFSPPPPTDGMEYVVMSSRSRAAGPTTSTDIVVPSVSPILSPVTGTVELVRPYKLYCQFADHQIFIRPLIRPDVLVMVLHMRTPVVEAGDHVVAGVTHLADSWNNDAPDSQENEYWGQPYPHFHVEVEAGGAMPVPGCLY
jgi:Ca2+-binding RTX toxin-like protein